MSTSRILYNVPCSVCHDNSSGKHYSVYACDGCAGFFKRSVRRNRIYHCKNRNKCVVDKYRRNQCRACRYRRCIDAGMNKDAVQNERGPRQTFPDRHLHITNPVTLRPESPIIPAPTQIPLPISTNFPAAPIFKLDLYVYEMAARILFYIVHWLRSVKNFQMANVKDQMISLLHCWHQIFILSVCEYKFDVPWMSLIHTIDRSNVVSLKSLCSIQEVSSRIQQLNLDYVEYFYLKISLLNQSTEQGSSLNRTNFIDEYLLQLENHVRRTYPLQPQRFEQLKLILTNLRTVSSVEVQNLFFKNILNYCSVELILRNLYQSIPQNC